MNRQSQHEARWGGCPRKELPTPAESPSEPPRFLGSWQWRQPAALERTTDWLDRTRRQREQLVATASGWLQLGQAVRVNRDPRVGGDMAGRTGAVHRLCGAAFADFTYVRFEPQGREKVERVRMLPLEILEPVE